MIISNQTPLSNLLHLGQISLLEQLFTEIYFGGCKGRMICSSGETKNGTIA